MANAYFKTIKLIIDPKYKGRILTETILKKLKRGTLLVRKDTREYYKLYNYTVGSPSFGLLALATPDADSYWDSVCWAYLYRVGTKKDMLAYMIEEVL